MTLVYDIYIYIYYAVTMLPCHSFILCGTKSFYFSCLFQFIPFEWRIISQFYRNEIITRHFVALLLLLSAIAVECRSQSLFILLSFRTRDCLTSHTHTHTDTRRENTFLLRRNNLMQTG